MAADREGCEDDGQVRLDRLTFVMEHGSGASIGLGHPERCLDLPQPVIGSDHTGTVEDSGVEVADVPVRGPSPGTPRRRAHRTRRRAKVTQGPGSKADGLAMAFKLIEAAQARWRALNALHLVALVHAGARFEHGKLRRTSLRAGGSARSTPH
jgi:hypothetical protein